MREAALLSELNAADCSEHKLPCVLIERMTAAEYDGCVDRWREDGRLPTPYVEWRALHSQVESTPNALGRLVAVEMPTWYHEIPKAALQEALSRALRLAGAKNGIDDLVPTGQQDSKSNQRRGISNGGWHPRWTDDEIIALRASGALPPFETVVAEVGASQTFEDMMKVKELNLPRKRPVAHATTTEKQKALF